MRMKLGDRLISGQPKLTLTTLPTHHHKTAIEPPGLLTPPLHPMASIPFQWEEVPGRPKIRPNKTISPCSSPSPINKPKSARFLNLPPRLIMLVDDEKVTDLPSPTTVLGGLELCSCTEGSFDFSASGTSMMSGSGEEVGVKAKITRLRRRRSFFGFPHRRFQAIENIYGSFKQMMMGRQHNEEKLRGNTREHRKGFYFSRRR